MRRMALFYFVSFWMALIIQFGWSRYMDIYGIAPNIILVMLLFIGLTRGPMAGQLMGFLWGLSWDVMNLELFGSHALVLACIGYLSGSLSRLWDESKIVTQVALVGVASVIYQAALMFVCKIFAPSQNLISLNYVVLTQPVFNMLITPAVFLLAQFLPETRETGTDFEGYI